MAILAQSDLTFICNTGELDQVCFGRYTAVLKFRKLTISIMTPYKVTDPDGNVSLYDPERNPEGAAVFAGLLDAYIDSYEIVPSSQPQLIIKFSTGWGVTLTEYGGYESFIFYAADGSCLPI